MPSQRNPKTQSIESGKTAKGVALCQIKITLKWTRPQIWRRIVVRSDMRLDHLHGVIQIAMGWMDCHLHQFIVGDRRNSRFYGVPDPDMFDLMEETLNEKRHTLADLAPQAKQKFIYEYDFGDSWMHEVLVEKILPPDPLFKHPVCLKGANACPPEDCGSLPGFYNLLEALADPRHPEHEFIKDWLGAPFDPKAFDADAVNRELRQLPAK